MTSFILTVLDDDIQGMVKSPQGMFIIETVQGKIIIERINQNIGRCGNELYSDLLPNNYTITNQSSSNNQKTNPPVPCRLRILVLYTQRAEDQSNNIRNTIQLANDQLNLAFTNSGINDREAELVFVGKTDYEEHTGGGSGDVNMVKDVNRFRIFNDGFIDGVHALRNTYDADLCVLIEDIQENTLPNGNPNYWGVAQSIKPSPALGFCIVDWEAATLHFSFTHEIGHLIGCRHDVDPNNEPFAYGHGFRNTTEGFRTVMAVTNACCSRELHFSNPDINFGGNPTGTATTNDNARVIEEQFENVMGFRQPNFLVNVDSDDLILINEGNIVSRDDIKTINTVIVPTETILSFTAVNSIRLKPGFKVERDAIFNASIAEVTTCGQLDNLPSDFDIAQDYGFDKSFKDNNLQINCFPNPVIDNLTIDIYKSSNDDDVSILLYDFTGKLLYQEVITDNGNNLSETISFETISSGTYFINIQIGGNLKTQKIIKL
jgi:hypothetical protein